MVWFGLGWFWFGLVLVFRIFKGKEQKKYFTFEENKLYLTEHFKEQILKLYVVRLLENEAFDAVISLF